MAAQQKASLREGVISGISKVTQDNQQRIESEIREARNWMIKDGVMEALIGLGSQTDPSWDDPLPIEETRIPVAALRPEMLPASLAGWVCDVAERMDVPLDYPAAAGIVALSAAVGRRASITPKRLDTAWKVTPNLWGAVVGRPGVMKTPAIREGLAGLSQIEQAARIENEAARARYENQSEVHKMKKSAWRKNGEKACMKGNAPEAFEEPPPEEPRERRFITNDPTVPKLHEILSGNPGGILLFRDELTGWLASLDAPGREGDRAFYLEGWDGGGSFSYDRIGRGSLHVEACCVSLLGGIQPGRLLTYGSDAVNGGPADDGLFQRLQILVWPDIPSECTLVDRLPNFDAFESFTTVFKTLCEVSPDSPIQAKFSAQAQELFDVWRAELEQRIRCGGHHEAMESHLSKYRSLMPSLALLFMLADWATKGGDNSVVDLRHVQLAAAWCSYLETHAVRVYSKLRSLSSDHARALAEKILKGDVPKVFAARDIYLKGWSSLNDPASVRKAAEILLDANWLKLQVDDDTGGRPSYRYLVNPKVGKVPSEE
jgi:hypothetical protein